MQVYSLNTQPNSHRYHQMLQTNYWFWQRGYEVIPFEYSQLLKGELDAILQKDAEDFMFFGSVGVMHEVFKRANRPAPPLLDFPEELQSFLGRKIIRATMGDIYQWLEKKTERFPVHIKPIQQKRFTGTVVHGFRDLLALADVANDAAIFVQDFIKITSEWRASILRKEIIHIGHYKGDPIVFPDKDTLLAGLQAFSSQPKGFAMDWGVTEDGRTVLIEVNDGFALGNYGVKGYLYTALLECRWRELMGLKDNGVGI